jgi:hypothetical protein
MSDRAISQQPMERRASLLSRRTGLTLAALSIIALPLIFNDTYWRTNLTICAINVLLALGLDFILGYAGQLNLGHSAFYGLGAYVSTLLIVKLGVPFWGAFAARGASARSLPCDRLARFCGHHLSNSAQLDKPDAGATWHIRHFATATDCNRRNVACRLS